MSRRTGDLALEVARYMARCQRRDGCLIGPHVRYGFIKHDGGMQTSAHRAVFTVHNGPIGEGLVVRHTCDTPQCVEPSHLLVGTHSDNELDKSERGRALTGLQHRTATVPPEVIDQAVAKYLRGGKSQAQMAREIGVAQSTFGRWVRGEARRDTSHPAVSVGKGRGYMRWLGSPTSATSLAAGSPRASGGRP